MINGKLHGYPCRSFCTPMIM